MKLKLTLLATSLAFLTACNDKSVKEIGIDELHSRFWRASMQHGVIIFPKPADNLANDANNGMPNRLVREMTAKAFGIGDNLEAVGNLADELQLGGEQ